MGKFTTVLYDLDGTLWESGPGITKAVQTALRACGIDEPDPDNLTSFIGPPLNVEFKRRYHFDDEETAKAIAVFRSYYDEKGIYENRLYPGVKKMLKDLKEAGICIGAASSKPQPLVDRLMDYFEIRQYFDVLVGSDPQDELKTEAGRTASRPSWRQRLRRQGTRTGSTRPWSGTVFTTWKGLQPMAVFP